MRPRHNLRQWLRIPRLTYKVVSIEIENPHPGLAVGDIMEGLIAEESVDVWGQEV